MIIRKISMIIRAISMINLEGRTGQALYSRYYCKDSVREVENRRMQKECKQKVNKDTFNVKGNFKLIPMKKTFTVQCLVHQ